MHIASSLSTEISCYWNSLIRLIYPSTCFFCNEPLNLSERDACSACLAKLPRLREPICPTCAMERPPHRSPGLRCSSCKSTKLYYQRGSAIFRYSDSMKYLLQQVKFSRKSRYLNALKRSIRDTKLPLSINDYDMIIPVPIDLHRKREREFNQSEIIARMIRSGKSAPPVRSILKKPRRSLPQSVLERNRRLTNVQGAFRLKRGVQISGKKLLIVDDIVTTGTTVNECAKCLKQAGASRIDFFSLARTVTL